MAATSTHVLCLTELPSEILLDIWQHLDIDGAFTLSSVNRGFHKLFLRRKASILLSVLARQFSPFDELLQVYTATADDLDPAGGRYMPRRVIFKHRPGDYGLVLSPRPEAWPVLSAGPLEGFIPAAKSRKSNAPAATALNTIVLTEKDLGPLLQHCSLVQKWEARFPQFRWFHQPEDCRTLRPHEAERFRRAFYRWWLYGIYFHGDFPRPHVGLPEPFVKDVRVSQLRYYTTTDLTDLMDLVETMKDVVRYYLCPRLLPEQDPDPWSVITHDAETRSQALFSGWIDLSSWGGIIKTYVKLGPQPLMHFFDNIASYPRKRLIAEARVQCPNITLDQESLQTAIRCTLDERDWDKNLPSLAQDNVGGIIDFDDERDGERVTFNGDASPDGLLPPGVRFIPAGSQYSPRGNDGWFLPDYFRIAYSDPQLIPGLLQSYQ